MRSAILATFNDRDHAQPVVDRLQQAGFHATIHDETNWQKRHFAERLAGVKVKVEEREGENAKRQLKEWDATEHYLDQAICCPECGSPDVDYPQVTRKFILPTLHAFMYRLRLLEKEFYCNTCQHTWPLRDKVEPQKDVLGWPIKGKGLQHNPDNTP
jgi:uncharacterized protein YbaR (Trm112 family)